MDGGWCGCRGGPGPEGRLRPQGLGETAFGRTPLAVAAGPSAQRPAPMPTAQPLPGRPAIARCTASSARLAVDLTVPRLIPVASAISASDIPP